MFLCDPYRALMTPCLMWVLAVDALNYCTVTFLRIMVSCTFSASGFPFAVCSTMAVLAAAEALHYLELRDESLWLVVKIINVTPVCDTFVCCVVIFEIDHDRTVFC